ncbi:hypothetical protein [Hasllibacter sp. MH4015]|uniref:hypothetical protein n=1 Tax=Hasllibacter sp. MH4015 TaxID=2854029 RepID=UPI001CD494E5|nr:hypothetical protein [Hasllibacter sp. MH4015]
MAYPRILLLVLLGVTACGPVPNDVNPQQQELDRLGIDSRRIALNGEISSTTLPGAGAAPGAVGANGLPVEAGATGDVTFLDPNNIAGIAEGAIAEAEAAGQTGGVFDNVQPQQASDVLPPPLIPRVAAFALRTTHLPGQQQWRRNPFRRDGQDLCAQFPSRDQAQDRFLADGGPERDPNGMDPDGDGFVCGFDPSALRAEAAAPAESFETLPAIDG